MALASAQLSGLLRRQRECNLAAFGAEQLGAMVKRDERQIKAMIRLIDDMLDVSRMRSGKLSIRPAPVEVTSLLERVTSDLSLQAAAAGSSLTLEAHAPVTGLWDEFRIEQVIVDLLTNALRYGGARPVEVSVHGAADLVRIDVRDDGRGIARADLERIFEPYERGAGNGELKGLGLGLYLSRQLAASHGGQLSVASTAGEGATFSLLLPVMDKAEAGASKASLSAM